VHFSYRYLIKVKKSAGFEPDYGNSMRAFAASPRLSPYFLSALPKRSPFATYTNYLNGEGPSGAVAPAVASSSEAGAHGAWQAFSLFNDNEQQPGGGLGRLEWNFNRL